jgi:hypothetical protein
MIEIADDLKPLLIQELRSYPMEIGEAVRIVNAEVEQGIIS